MSSASDRSDLLSEGSDMTEILRRYILSLISAAVVCSVLKGLSAKSSSSRVVHLLCGTFLMFTFIAPLKHIDLEDMIGSHRWDDSIAHEAVSWGEELSWNAMGDIISDEIASYVEEKASSFGAQVRVAVAVSDEEIPVPTGIYIEGQVNPYIRRQIEDLILRELDIGGEDVRWTGQH